MPNIAYICEIGHSSPLKAVVWMGGTREDLKLFPEAAQNSLGFELYRVQCGLDPKDWKVRSWEPGRLRTANMAHVT
jgi:phage-related protein